ncbi:hypothetical protein [Arthrobacter cupressi]|uniref:Uncharacterized protein n=1 Tax=Arthrobacter cupressi TaxID=1045773 RepID=A0A1G8LLM0_9MICC|nr:hypothetical protein [Arthrobacter cupressi]NYD77591.1 hypothetical protein [Arthrobacter cupressi]SDI56367.1 hypothetical protein SAMN05216555_10398 [Arthrobacter cupressi]
MNTLPDPAVPTAADLARNRSHLLGVLGHRAAVRRRRRIAAGIAAAAVLLGGATAGVLALGAPPAAVLPEPVAQEPGRQPGSRGTAPLYDAYASIPEHDIERLPGGVNDDILWDARNPYYGYDKLPVVARVHIDSIDGGRTFSPISEQYVFPQTVGKMTVLEVYKGGITPGTQINYSRLGGIVTFDDYWKSLNQAQRDKRLHLNGGKIPAHSKYVQDKLMDDIDIEAGKEYIVLLQPQSSKDGKHREYLIDGLQFGLREVRGTGAGTMALNNETKKWENLGKVVRLP